MSSEFLSSSYSRYKEDTTTFAKWLACTAQAVGYSEDSFTDRTNSGKLPPPTGRLKGKARKEAKMMVGKESKEKVSTNRRPTRERENDLLFLYGEKLSFYFTGAILPDKSLSRTIPLRLLLLQTINTMRM